MLMPLRAALLSQRHSPGAVAATAAPKAGQLIYHPSSSSPNVHPALKCRRTGYHVRVFTQYYIDASAEAPNPRRLWGSLDNQTVVVRVSSSPASTDCTGQEHCFARQLTYSVLPGNKPETICRGKGQVQANCRPKTALWHHTGATV